MVRLGAWQFRPLVHYFYIPGITENPVAFFARQFPHNAQVLQMTQALVDRGRGDADLFHQPPCRGNWTLHQRSMNPQSRCCRPAKAVDFVAMLTRQIDKLPGRVHCLGCSGNDRLREEIEPGFPVTGQADVIEQLVIILSMGLEIEAL